MLISNDIIKSIEEILRVSIRHKLANYHPESNSMPFHTRLLGKDRLALYSFIHSLNTNFGSAIFEPVAIELSKSRFKRVSSQVTPGKKISEQAQIEIQNIINKLTTAETLPNKHDEIEKIRLACQKGKLNHIKPTKIDLFIEEFDGTIHLFDIKTAKPNVGDAKEFKRTLLEWIATTLTENPHFKIGSYIAIPYNPYAPDRYNRWTMRGMIDIDTELFVAEEFWDFLGGKGTFDLLLNSFEKVGIELRPEIDLAFERFK